MREEINNLLQPTDSRAIVDLLHSDPTPIFTQDVPFYKTTERLKSAKEGGQPITIVTLRRSLYGEILHRRGVSDELLKDINNEDAQNLAFNKVDGVSSTRQRLIDILSRSTPATRPDLLVDRISAALVAPQQILGHNARLVTTFCEVGFSLTSENPPIVAPIDWQRDRETVVAYAKTVGASSVPSSQYQPAEYARTLAIQAYSRFGPEVAKVAGLVAMELQALPTIPLEKLERIAADNLGRHTTEPNKLQQTMDSMSDRTFGGSVKRLYFLNKMVLSESVHASLVRQLVNAHVTPEAESDRQFYVFVDKPIKR